MVPDPEGPFVGAVHAAIRRHDLLPSGVRPGEEKTRVVVALSGGPDSVALLLALDDLARRYPRSGGLAIELVAAHLNHGLRGRAADEDQAFVEQLAAERQLPCEVGRADVKAEAAAAGLGIEEAARIARRRFLAEVARRCGAAKVALGHTAADRVETILFHILRGTGVEGLASLGPRAEMGPELIWPIEIVRPLIDVTRREVLAFLEARRQPWREDETNRADAYTRNRLRSDLLPHLKAEFNPKVAEALARLSDQAAAACEVLRDALDAAWRQVARELPPEPGARPEPGAILLDADGFTALRPWLRGALLRRAIERLGGGLKHMSAARTDEVVRALLSDHVAGPVDLPGGLVAARRRGAIRIGPRGAPPPPP